MPINPLLQQERDRATFAVELMVNFLDGGAERTRRRREIEGWILNDPAWRHTPLEFLSREEIYATQLHKAAKCVLLLQDKGITDNYEKYWLTNLIELDYGSGLHLHETMFIPAILGQASDEQIDRWLGPALEYKVLGTYAQTEMGHGTFLRGIETTATYDRSTQEFVLDTPTVTATKWWPGSLGKTTNHTVVMAKLVLDGRVCGSHLFFLRIRDDSHRPLPGITLGDIGPKFGYQATDNGFMRLRRVRVPRDHMLMRHAWVTPEGRYERRGEKEGTGDKLSYGTMTFVRALIVGGAARSLSRALTIALRYSMVRQQGYSDEETGGSVTESRLIDYTTQQHKLVPLLAQAYAFFFCGEHIREMHFEVAAEIADGKLERLSEHHALTSCLKAVCSEIASDGIEKCRKACGGHGYSLASGLPQLYMHLTPACTYEGDTTVLLLQTARYLLKCHSELYSRPRHLPAFSLPPSVQYLQTTQKVDPLPFDVTALDWLCAQLQERARRVLQRVGESFQADLRAGTSWHLAFQRHAIQATHVSKMHATQYILVDFCEVVKTAGDLTPVLTQLASLYGLHTLVEESGDFLQTGCIVPECVPRCQAAFENCLNALRPDLIALVDAFDVCDLKLNSVLGRYDGQVYDNLYAWAQASPLNQSEVHSSFETTLRPLIQGDRLPPLSKL